MNNNVVVTSSKNKTDCFAWLSNSKCNALNSKNCANCGFYKNKKDVPNYEKYISKNDLLERRKDK